MSEGARKGHLHLVLAVCLGFFSYVAALLVSKYGPFELIMMIGTTSLALIIISLWFLWNKLQKMPEMPEQAVASNHEEEMLN